MTANDGIDLVVEPGEIHALLGENGAGKSTLMNVLYGLYQPDAGEILVDGERARFHGPSDAMAAGIGMVHQHFMLVPVFTVAENVGLGHEHTSGLGFLKLGFLDQRRARREVAEVSRRYGLEVPPDALVADLPVGVQQRVEIVKALVRNAKVLILDEPTSALTPQETDELMQVMRALRDGGTSIVFITHKLREVKAVADTITVIRRGKVVGQVGPETPAADLASMMVGRTVQLSVDKRSATPGNPVLEVTDARVVDQSGQVQVDGVSFTVHEGEVFAVAGVQGNGQTELTEALIGIAPLDSGRIVLDGRDVTRADVHEILSAGVGYVPEDRQHDGLIESFTIAENLVLDVHDEKPYANGAALNLRAIREHAEARVTEYDVRTQSVDAYAGTLSGGNQQKVVLARELSRPLRLLVVAQPTRGVDVGSMEFVHKRIVEARDGGAAVVLVSTELDEVLSLADRIAVMYRGSIIGEVPGGTSAEEIGLLMAGTAPEDIDRHQLHAVAASGNPAFGIEASDAEERP